MFAGQAVNGTNFRPTSVLGQVLLPGLGYLNGLPHYMPTCGCKGRKILDPRITAGPDDSGL